MNVVEGINGVPRYEENEFHEKQCEYCVLIPIINEGERILTELKHANKHGIHQIADIIICDGDSTDQSTQPDRLKELGVNTLLIKKDVGKQGSQLRMGFSFALGREYKGIITIDGNNKDSIENVPDFIAKLEEGYDFIQGSRFIKGGRAVRTPLIRSIAVRLIHAPLISLTAKKWMTDTTNNFRGYSARYIMDARVNIFRDIFVTYELLAYLSVRASQLGMKVCEIPVSRCYPAKTKVPTKISLFKGNSELLKILLYNFAGKYKPR